LSSVERECNVWRVIETLLTCSFYSIHKWWNKSDKWARMMFILIASEPVQIDGKTLEGNM
jgi:hypothetical protein